MFASIEHTEQSKGGQNKETIQDNKGQTLWGKAKWKHIKVRA